LTTTGCGRPRAHRTPRARAGGRERACITRHASQNAATVTSCARMGCIARHGRPHDGLRDELCTPRRTCTSARGWPLRRRHARMCTPHVDKCARPPLPGRHAGLCTVLQTIQPSLDLRATSHSRSRADQRVAEPRYPSVREPGEDRGQSPLKPEHPSDHRQIAGLGQRRHQAHLVLHPRRRVGRGRLESPDERTYRGRRAGEVRGLGDRRLLADVRRPERSQCQAAASAGGDPAIQSLVAPPKVSGCTVETRCNAPGCAELGERDLIEADDHESGGRVLLIERAAAKTCRDHMRTDVGDMFDQSVDGRRLLRLLGDRGPQCTGVSNKKCVRRGGIVPAGGRCWRGQH
jgi:hypothetical protein